MSMPMPPGRVVTVTAPDPAEPSTEEPGTEESEPVPGRRSRARTVPVPTPDDPPSVVEPHE